MTTVGKIVITPSDLSVTENFSSTVAQLNHLNLPHQHIVLGVLTTATEVCLNQRYYKEYILLTINCSNRNTKYQRLKIDQNSCS